MTMRYEGALRKVFIILAATAVLCAAAAAGSQRLEPAGAPSVTDFAFKYSLDANSEGRVYKIHITNDIFRRLRRSYERDIAVVASDANPVPCILRDAWRPYRASNPVPETPMKTTVPRFPLPPAASAADAAMMGITIITGKDGQVIEIVGDASRTPGGAGKFLADLSKLDAMIAAMPDRRPIMGYSIEIPAGGEKDAVAYADVYLSRNLRDWKKVARKEPLIRLRRGDDTVTSGAIEIDSGINSSGLARYLMLEIEGEWEFPDSLAV